MDDERWVYGNNVKTKHNLHGGLKITTKTGKKRDRADRI